MSESKVPTELNKILKSFAQPANETLLDGMTKFEEELKGITKPAITQISKQVEQMKKFAKSSDPASFMSDMNQIGEAIKNRGDNSYNRPAKFLVDNLQKVIRKIEADTPDDQDVLLLVSVDGRLYIVESVGYVDPSLVTFECVDFENQSYTWMLHHTAVKFLIKWFARDDQEEKKRKIGFLEDK